MTHLRRNRMVRGMRKQGEADSHRTLGSCLVTSGLPLLLAQCLTLAGRPRVKRDHSSHSKSRAAERAEPLKALMLDGGPTAHTGRLRGQRGIWAAALRAPAGSQQASQNSSQYPELKTPKRRAGSRVRGTSLPKLLKLPVSGGPLHHLKLSDNHLEETLIYGHSSSAGRDHTSTWMFQSRL